MQLISPRTEYIRDVDTGITMWAWRSRRWSVGMIKSLWKEYSSLLLCQLEMQRTPSVSLLFRTFHFLLRPLDLILTPICLDETPTIFQMRFVIWLFKDLCSFIPQGFTGPLSWVADRPSFGKVLRERKMLGEFFTNPWHPKEVNPGVLFFQLMGERRGKDLRNIEQTESKNLMAYFCGVKGMKASGLDFSWLMSAH